MTKPIVDFPVFDADNHMYENTDAFTQFLPKEYEGLVKYVQVNGRTKIALRNVISDYIPNPTFEVVGRPGASEELFKHGNPEGKTRREIIGKPIRSPEAFFSPEPRLKLMDELGLDRALMWPTLASLLEERLDDDPQATHVVIHALNQWMHEHWTFDYEGRIFPSPVITLPIVSEAIKELEWVVERGAKIILIRPAPVPGFEGRRSFALPEFDPFWERVQELDLVVGMHSGDSGYQRYLNEWEGLGDQEMSIARGARRANPAFVSLSSQKDNLVDAMASIIGHGLATRFPRLRFMPVEYACGWIKRGATGVIGTNRSDGAATMRAIVADAPALRARHVVAGSAMKAALARGAQPVDLEGWAAIDAAEVARGAGRQSPRIKLAHWHELLAAARGSAVGDVEDVDGASDD